MKTSESQIGYAGLDELITVGKPDVIGWCSVTFKSEVIATFKHMEDAFGFKMWLINSYFNAKEAGSRIAAEVDT